MKQLFPAGSAGKHLLISEVLTRNNFDCIRFFLAAAVIYSHCFVSYYGVIIGKEPVSIFTSNQIDLGGVAVDFFFVISGFLIVRSFNYSRNVYEYFIKRLLRIIPGFFVAYLVSVFILGAIGTMNSLHLLGHWKFYLHALHLKSIVINLVTLTSPPDAVTFSKNPLPNLINAPLWSIQYEFVSYILIPVLGLVTLFKRNWVALVAFLTCYIVFILQTFGSVTIEKLLNQHWEYFNPSLLPRLLSFFFAGACFYFYRSYIVRKRFLMILSIIAVLFAAWWVHGINIILPLAGTYLIFYFAYHPRIRLYGFAKKGDFSYGLYLYGWPIQQLVIHFFMAHLNVYRLFFISFSIAFVAAYVSWHIVESPFLKMKKKRESLLKVKQPVSAEMG